MNKAPLGIAFIDYRLWVLCSVIFHVIFQMVHFQDNNLISA